MSWDVVICHANGRSHAADRPEECQDNSLGDAAEVRNRLSAYFDELEWLDSSWGLLLGERFSLEFRLNAASPVESITLHVRGSGDPLGTIASLCKHFGWHALDRATGQLLDLDNPRSQGWIEFQAFRERVLKQYRRPLDKQRA
jgi:hypothetical protein